VMPEHRLTYPSTLESSERFLDDLQGLLKEYGVEQPLYQRLCLVLSEAFNNALLHGNKQDPAKNILVVLRVNEKEIFADITDQGKGGAEKVRARKVFGLMADHGRGIDLMQRLATATSFAEVSDGGLKVTVSFSRESGKERVR